MLFVNNKSSGKKPASKLSRWSDDILPFNVHVNTDTAFKQQRLKAWQPLLTPGPVIISFFVIGVVFIPIGAVLYTFSNAVSNYIQI